MAPWDGYETDLLSMGVYGIGIALYTLLVALLYVPLGTRMMFAKRMAQGDVATTGRRFVYVLAFPFLSFAFFLVVAASMLFMSNFTDSSLDEAGVLPIAMAVVLAIRVCAYFSETAAADLARVMPLSMLAVVLVTNGFGDLKDSVGRLGHIGDDPALLGMFFIIVVVAEFFLRAIYEVLGRPNKEKPAPSRRA